MGCDDGGGDGSTMDPPTFDEVRERIFEPSCAFSTCHTGASPAGELSLAGDSYAHLVDIPAMQDPDTLRVEPGSPETSYVMRKLEGRQLSGEPMPPGAPLSEERLALIRDWIAAGAIR
jgi:hypothetical protein